MFRCRLSFMRISPQRIRGRRPSVLLKECLVSMTVQLSYQWQYPQCCKQFLHTATTFLNPEDTKPQTTPQNPIYNDSIQVQYGAVIDSAKSNTALESKEQFALVLKEFLSREKYRRGHVNFIKLALQRMDEFGLERDLLTYNRILDMFPKGKFVAKRMLDALWPRPLPQTELALDLLTKMEEYGIRPDYNTYMLLVEVFGKTSLPVQKCCRIAYWFDKYENADPFKIDGDLPSDSFELSKLVLQRVTGRGGQITELRVPSSDEDSHIISGSTESQLRILHSLGERCGAPLLHVEGPHRLWLRKLQQFYYSLRLLPDSTEGASGNETEENEGPILGVCVCQPGSKEGLKVWLGALQEAYPVLGKATVVYNIWEIPVDNQESAEAGERAQLEDGDRTNV